MSQVWKNEWWFKKIKTDFPTLLFITEDEKRIDYINKISKEFNIIVIVELSQNYTFVLDKISKK